MNYHKAPFPGFLARAAFTSVCARAAVSEPGLITIPEPPALGRLRICRASRVGGTSRTSRTGQTCPTGLTRLTCLTGRMSRAGGYWVSVVGQGRLALVARFLFDYILPRWRCASVNEHVALAISIW